MNFRTTIDPIAERAMLIARGHLVPHPEAASGVTWLPWLDVPTLRLDDPDKISAARTLALECEKP